MHYTYYTYYTLRLGYIDNHAAAPPLALKDAKCDIAAEYTKKKNVIRLTLSDQSEYLFMTHDPAEMNQWQSKIQFHAGKTSRLFSHIYPYIVGGVTMCMPLIYLISPTCVCQGSHLKVLEFFPCCFFMSEKSLKILESLDTICTLYVTILMV